MDQPSIPKTSSIVIDLPMDVRTVVDDMAKRHFRSTRSEISAIVTCVVRGVFTQPAIEAALAGPVSSIKAAR